MRTPVATPDAPKALGPYSQAIKANGFVFVSGQTPINPINGIVMGGSADEQTEQALRNIAAILKAAGSSMDKVVRCGVFLKDMNDFAKMNAVYGKHFTEPYPARTTVEAARLPKDVLVEIDVVALE
ncbi:MAG: RidA family protein [Acidobacteriales bacterium]|nr:RidA family protein [Terriglobales bacterium]